MFASYPSDYNVRCYAVATIAKTYLRSGLYLFRVAQLLCGTDESAARVLYTGGTAPTVPNESPVPDESLPATCPIPTVADNHVPVE